VEVTGAENVGDFHSFSGFWTVAGSRYKSSVGAYEVNFPANNPFVQEDANGLGGVVLTDTDTAKVVINALLDAVAELRKSHPE
jgi:hypothetical protein